MADIITVTDLPAALQQVEGVDTMVAGANSKASRVAPCLVASDPVPTAGQLAEAKLILLGAIKRWCESGSGALQSQQAGIFGMTVDTRQKSGGYRLWPSEITDLQDICKTGTEPGREAFAIDTVPASSAHLPWCSINFGATYCSCGADLTDYEYPLYEGGVLSGDYY